MFLRGEIIPKKVKIFSTLQLIYSDFKKKELRI